ncbi:MAG: TolC family protein [Spirochaetota bacterium]
MHHRNLLAAAFIFAAAAPHVAARDAVVVDIETAAALATATDTKLVELERDVDAAADRLGWAPYRDDLALSLSGSLAGDELPALAAGGTASLDASVDVLPQLTLSGRLAGTVSSADPGPADPVTGSMGVTLRPLADAQGEERDRIAYERAALALESRARAVAYTAVTSLLDAVAGHEELALAEADVALAERRLVSVEALAERERATDEEVEVARAALRTARHARERKALAAERAAWSLADTMGVAPDAMTLPDWDSLEIAASAARARARAGDSSSRPEPGAMADADRSVGTAALDAEAARVELAATRRFTPELSAGAQARFPLEPEGAQQHPRYSLSLDVTVRPSDWAGSAKREAQEDLTFAERALESARQSARYDARSALLELEIAFEEQDAALHGLELAERELARAQFRFERGDIARLRLDAAELDVAKARAEVGRAGATVVRRWYAIDLGQY